MPDLQARPSQVPTPLAPSCTHRKVIIGETPRLRRQNRAAEITAYLKEHPEHRCCDLCQAHCLITQHNNARGKHDKFRYFPLDSRCMLNPPVTQG